MSDQEIALIVGAGSGLSASLARLCHAEGMKVALAARNTAKLAPLVDEISAQSYSCDATEPEQVTDLMAAVCNDLGTPDLVIYNASARQRGPLADLDPAAVENAIKVSCFAGFLVGQAATRVMLQRGGGTILFTGASASVKGYAQSAAFAMGKFGLRGLAQSMARELAPQSIHVAHFVIDGGIGESAPDNPDSRLHPDEIAKTYLAVHRQHRSAWTWEVELRPWVERF